MELKVLKADRCLVAKILSDFGMVVDENKVKHRAYQLLVNLLGITNDLRFLKREDPMIAGELYIELSVFGTRVVKTYMHV